MSKILSQTVIRAAIIGCGPNTPGKGGAHSFAYAHAYGMQAHPEFQLVAACSRTAGNVRDFCSEFSGTVPYQDYREMLRKERPDLVSICAFPPDREEMVMAALEAKVRGIWIEKPFAVSLGAARRMMQTAKKQGVRLFVNHQRRYGKPFEWMRAAVRKKQIGDLIGIDIVQPGGCLLNFGPHLADAVLFFLGDRKAEMVFGAVDMNGAGKHQGTPVENKVLATIHFAGGVRVTVEIGQRTCSMLPILRAHGTEGFAELHLEAKPDMKSVFRARLKNDAKVVNPPTNEHFHHSEDGALYMKRVAEDIARALLQGSPTRIDADEAYRGLEILMGIYESDRRRQMVNLPLPAEGEFTMP